LKIYRINYTVDALKIIKSSIVAGIFSVLSGCVSLQGVDTFTSKGVLSGSQYTEELCDFQDSSVWVVVDGNGECVRYFQSGLESSNPIALVHFHGDRMWCGTRNTGCKKVIGYYDAHPSSLQKSADNYARQTGFPYIRVSRPGVYGSSGVHGSRRLEREINIMSAALDVIKARYVIDAFSASGQSGGGHVVTSLITKRSDLLCAVSSSGAVAVKMRILQRGWRRDVTGYSTYFDPIDHIDEIKSKSDVRIFLLGDPRDINVPFATQSAYHKKAVNAGIDATLIELKAGGSEHHGLVREGIIVSTWCALGFTKGKIIRRSSSGYLTF
jgi:hypothetical protein